MTLAWQRLHDGAHPLIEVLLGIAIGRYGLGLVRFEGFVAAMYAFGTAASLFMPAWCWIPRASRARCCRRRLPMAVCATKTKAIDPAQGAR